MENTAYIFSILMPLVSFYLMRPQKTSQGIKISPNKKSLFSSLPWYNLGLLGVFCLSAALRFRDLGRFNSLVFDEYHFVNFAKKYLLDMEIFDVHPPLGKYLITIGIWVGKALSLGEDVMNNEAGILLSTISYRWMNAFVGSLIPVMMASLAYKLSQRCGFALITGYFAALDGFFIIESRYALLEVYIVFFGLFAQLALLKALKAQGYKHHFWMILSGIGFGATVSAKWSGLAFWGPVIALWVANEILQRLANVGQFCSGYWRAVRDFVFNLGVGASVSFRIENGKIEFKAVLENLKTNDKTAVHQLAPSPATNSTCSENISNPLEESEGLSVTSFTPFTQHSPLINLDRLKLYHITFYLGIVPAVFYVLQWIPHMQLHPNTSLVGLHKQMMGFHQNLGANSHPYCSSWDTWPLMLRPISIYHKIGLNGSYYEDIHSIGNPLLWWFSTVAIVAMFLILLRETLRWIFRSRQGIQKDEMLPSVKSWVALFLFLNWAASFVPYTLINRCAFIYHYMPSLIFAEIAAAWLVDNWLRSKRIELRLIGTAVLIAVSASFVYFAPIFYGDRLPHNEYMSRMWLNTWI